MLARRLAVCGRSIPLLYSTAVVGVRFDVREQFANSVRSCSVRVRFGFFPPDLVVREQPVFANSSFVFANHICGDVDESLSTNDNLVDYFGWSEPSTS